MIHLDYGKNAFTFIRRSDNKAIRVKTRPDGWGKPDPERQRLFEKIRSDSATSEEQKRYDELQHLRSQEILERPLGEIFIIEDVQPDVPAKARINNSITCEDCGESTMEIRSRMFRGKSYCIPCFEKRDRRFSSY